MKLSIRYKLLTVLALTVLVALTVYVFLATRLMTSDKIAYAHDLNATVANATAEEVRTVLEGLRERLLLLGAAEEPEGVARSLLAGDPDIIRVAVYRRGDDDWERVYDLAEADRLEPLAVSLMDLAQLDLDQPPPLDEAVTEGIAVMNRSLPPRAPLLLVAAGTEGFAVVADVRPDRLQRIFARSDLYRGYLVDDGGRVIAASDSEQVLAREDLSAVPVVRAAVTGGVDTKALEYVDDAGEAWMGAYARVDVARLSTISEIDREAALAASRKLVRRSLLFGVAILCVAIIVSVFYARRLTTPIRLLRDAAEKLEGGKFDVDPGVTTKDEIGDLAAAFMKMASGLRDAQAQLIQSAKMAAFGQMGAGITHEVKNPLAGILGFAQLGRDTLSDPEIVEECFEHIEKEAKRCTVIVNSLLQFARKESFEYEYVDLNKVVGDSVRMLDHQVHTHGHQLTSDLADDLPTVRGNSGQLQQVLMNFVLNAQQAMATERGGEIRVATRRLEDGRVECSVTDDGPGIPPEIQDRIMEPFFTTKETGEGTGLGLSVSYGIVQEHGGEIVLESKLGFGTTFRVRFPAAPSSPSAPEPAAPERSDEPAPAARGEA